MLLALINSQSLTKTKDELPFSLFIFSLVHFYLLIYLLVKSLKLIIKIKKKVYKLIYFRNLIKFIESSLTSEQKEWLHIKNSIYKLMPKGKVNLLFSDYYFRNNFNKVQLISINYNVFFTNLKKRRLLKYFSILLFF